MSRTHGVRGVRVLLALALAAAAAVASAAPPAGLALAEGTDLWGGPGGRGTGAFGAVFGTVVYVQSREATIGTVEFWGTGRLLATVPFTTPAGNRWNAVTAPPELEGKGAFMWRVRTDKAVSAWANVSNSTAQGEYGASFAGFESRDFLVPGDEALASPLTAATTNDPGDSRTNVGVLCSPLGGDACSVEVAAFLNGALAGTGTLSANQGYVAQQALSALIPATAGKGSFTVRFRVASGTGTPYATRNDNRSSDAIAIPLAVTRGAFSTAPRIDVFTASPQSGCTPLTTTFVWSTTGATRVSISGVGSNLPPAGSQQGTFSVSTDVLMTAYSSSGLSTNRPLHVDVAQSTAPPTPAPATATLSPNGTVEGYIPSALGNVTATFTRQDSTGSTFVIAGNAWRYTAGTTTGTDVVTLTVTGACGPATATFTATVVPEGAPAFISVEAQIGTPVGPVNYSGRACNMTDYTIAITWATTGTRFVSIDRAVTGPLPPAGYYPFEFKAGDPATQQDFLVTAHGQDGTDIQQAISVPVDSYPVVIVTTPAYSSVATFTDVPLTITLTPSSANPNLLGWGIVQNQSGGRPGGYSFPTLLWKTGRSSGIDVLRFYYQNGCGILMSEVSIKVTAP